MLILLFFVTLCSSGARAVGHLLTSTSSPIAFQPAATPESVNSPQDFEAFVNDDDLSDVTFVVEGSLCVLCTSTGCALAVYWLCTGCALTLCWLSVVVTSIKQCICI